MLVEHFTGDEGEEIKLALCMFLLLLLLLQPVVELLLIVEEHELVL